jgi:hypothetical protein
MELPGGAVPRPTKNQTIQQYVDEELSKHVVDGKPVAFDDLPKYSFWDELSASDNFKAMMARSNDDGQSESAPAETKDDKSGETNVSSSPPASQESNKSGQPETPDAGGDGVVDIAPEPSVVVEPEPSVEKVESVPVPSSTMSTPAQVVRSMKLVTNVELTDSENVLARVSYGKFGVEDLDHAASAFNEYDKRESLFYDIASSYIPPAIVDASRTVNEDGVCLSHALSFENYDHLKRLFLREDGGGPRRVIEGFGRLSNEPIHRFTQDVRRRDGAADSVMMPRAQGEYGLPMNYVAYPYRTAVDEVSLPAYRASYLMAMQEVRSYFLLDRSVLSVPGRPSNVYPLETFLREYISEPFRKEMRFVAEYGDHEEREIYNRYLTESLVFPAFADERQNRLEHGRWLQPLWSLCDDTRLGRALRDRSFSVAMSQMLTLRPGTYTHRKDIDARTTSEITELLNSFNAGAGCQWAQTYSAWCLGGVGKQLDIKMHGSYEDDNERSHYRVLAAGANLLMHSRTLMEDTIRVMVQYLLTPLYGDDNARFLSRNVATPLGPQRGLRYDGRWSLELPVTRRIRNVRNLLRQWILRVLNQPDLNRYTGERVWSSFMRSARRGDDNPYLPFPFDAEQARRHLGLQLFSGRDDAGPDHRTRFATICSQAVNNKVASLLELIDIMFSQDIMPSRSSQNARYRVRSLFSKTMHVNLSAGYMTTVLIKGWENPTVCTPRHPRLEVDRLTSSDVVDLPFDGALNFLLYGLDVPDEAKPYAEWSKMMNRIVLPSQEPACLYAENVIANDVLARIMTADRGLGAVHDEGFMARRFNYEDEERYVKTVKYILGLYYSTPVEGIDGRLHEYRSRAYGTDLSELGRRFSFPSGVNEGPTSVWYDAGHDPQIGQNANLDIYSVTDFLRTVSQRSRATLFGLTALKLWCAPRRVRPGANRAVTRGPFGCPRSALRIGQNVQLAVGPYEEENVPEQPGKYLTTASIVGAPKMPESKCARFFLAFKRDVDTNIMTGNSLTHHHYTVFSPSRSHPDCCIPVDEAKARMTKAFRDLFGNPRLEEYKTFADNLLDAIIGAYDDDNDIVLGTIRDELCIDFEDLVEMESANNRNQPRPGGTYMRFRTRTEFSEDDIMRLAQTYVADLPQDDPRRGAKYVRFGVRTDGFNRYKVYAYLKDLLIEACTKANVHGEMMEYVRHIVNGYMGNDAFMRGLNEYTALKCKIDERLRPRQVFTVSTVELPEDKVGSMVSAPVGVDFRDGTSKVKITTKEVTLLYQLRTIENEDTSPLLHVRCFPDPAEQVLDWVTLDAGDVDDITQPPPALAQMPRFGTLYPSTKAFIFRDFFDDERRNRRTDPTPGAIVNRFSYGWFKEHAFLQYPCYVTSRASEKIKKSEDLLNSGRVYSA